jgi:hypothetical protein
MDMDIKTMLLIQNLILLLTAILIIITKQSKYYFLDTYNYLYVIL